MTRVSFGVVYRRIQLAENAFHFHPPRIELGDDKFAIRAKAVDLLQRSRGMHSTGLFAWFPALRRPSAGKQREMSTFRFFLAFKFSSQLSRFRFTICT
jgi:hypothetical protein